MSDVMIDEDETRVGNIGNDEEDENEFNQHWSFVGEVNGVATFLYKSDPLPINPSHAVRLSDKRISQTVIKDGDVCKVGERDGYSTVCGSHYCEHGCFFFEVHIFRANEQGRPNHVRIGFADHRFNTNQPVGSDKYSYGYRDRGDKFHNGMEVGGMDYGDSFKTGDVIGCMISLPEKRTKLRIQQERTEDVGDDGNPIVFVRNHIVSEKVVNSSISFYKNGKWQGIAFTDLERSRYYPAVSLFRGASVRVVFGPGFRCYPDNLGRDQYSPFSSLFSLKRKRKPFEIIDEQYPLIVDHTKDLEARMEIKQSPRKKKYLLMKQKSPISPRGRKSRSEKQ